MMRESRVTDYCVQIRRNVERRSRAIDEDDLRGICHSEERILLIYKSLVFCFVHSLYSLCVICDNETFLCIDMFSFINVCRVCGKQVIVFISGQYHWRERLDCTMY